ncbi:hypothetical protein BD626DRAFT_95300 [Schizophyllum amplum]|uniref:Uncharacterized protein n=1 Tax=Schizophyllum amplum TaxID=97359 RepID=A0A550C898_9AGAR|nr:hypothetical protein BD626DRAFT_95300 [Auriculariopsis ampla]
MCTIVEAVGPSPRDNLRRRQQCSDGHDSLGPARRLDAVLTTDHLLSPIARTTPIDQGRCSHHQSAMLVARRQYLNCCSETTAGQSMRKVSNPRHVRNRRRDTSSRLSPSLVGTRAYMPPSTGKRTRDCVWAGYPFNFVEQMAAIHQTSISQLPVAKKTPYSNSSLRPINDFQRRACTS